MRHETRDSATADLERALRDLAGEDRDPRVPPHVHQAVMQVWDATMTSVRRRQVRRRPWWIAVAAGAAATGGVLAGLFTSSGRPDAIPAHAPPITIVGRSPSAENGTHHDAEKPVVKPPTRARRASRARPAARAADVHGGIVLVADPVLDASALSVVRVRMPRSTLAHLGIPIADPEASGSVDLEVLVGEDGIARTIRRAMPVTGSDPQE